MLNTRLILVEGRPGSGKTTTATNIGRRLKEAGVASHCFLEDDLAGNPIILTDGGKGIRNIINSFQAGNPTLPYWRDLSAGMPEGGVSVLESRFWQNTLMFMFLTGHSEEEIFASHDLVLTSVLELKPALIYLRHSTSERVDRANAERAKSHSEHARRVHEAFESQAWFKVRGLGAVEGMPRFYEEWNVVAQGLWNRFTGEKLEVLDPHENWDKALKSIFGFLGL